MNCLKRNLNTPPCLLRRTFVFSRHMTSSNSSSGKTTRPIRYEAHRLFHSMATTMADTRLHTAPPGDGAALSGFDYDIDPRFWLLPRRLPVSKDLTALPRLQIDHQVSILFISQTILQPPKPQGPERQWISPNISILLSAPIGSVTQTPNKNIANHPKLSLSLVSPRVRSQR